MKRRRQDFDTATGGALRPLDDAKASQSVEILRFKLQLQCERMREIIDAAPVHQDKLDGRFVLEDMLATAARLGALQLTCDRRDKTEE